MEGGRGETLQILRVNSSQRFRSCWDWSEMISFHDFSQRNLREDWKHYWTIAAVILGKTEGTGSQKCNLNISGAF